MAKSSVDKAVITAAMDGFLKEAGDHATFKDFVKHLVAKGIVADSSKKTIAAVRRALGKNKGKLASSNIDWKVAEPRIAAAFDYFRRQRVRPTLRTVYYQLVSQNIIPNTKSSYKSLSAHLVEMRKKGLVAWDAIEDSARKVYGKFKDYRFKEGVGESVARQLQEKLGEFAPKEILREFFNYYASSQRASVDRWADQPVVAEVWIEKEALANTLLSWTEDLDIKIRINKGYSSWTFIYENAMDLERILANHKRVAIFYIGDLDPSGEDMERFLKEALAFFGIDDDRVDFKRLCLTEDQVDEFDLPPRPEDAETIAKLHRDSRYAHYQKEYVVEVDSLLAYVPDRFREMVFNAINEVWDEGIFNDLEAQADDENQTMSDALIDVKTKALELLKNLPSEGGITEKDGQF